MEGWVVIATAPVRDLGETKGKDVVFAMLLPIPPGFWVPV
jgi:hypothetical protein